MYNLIDLYKMNNQIELKLNKPMKTLNYQKHTRKDIDGKHYLVTVE